MTQALRCLESSADQMRLTGFEVAQMYADKLDAVIIRGAFPPKAIAHAASFLDDTNATDSWNRPNRPVPVIDLRLLGVGAAPTATTPTGPDTETYLEAASKTPNAIRALFGDTCDPFVTIEKRFQQLSGLTSAVPEDLNQRLFSPCTVRSIPPGAGLMVHHDNHYQLPVYENVRDQIDTALLLSFFVVLQRPNQGGRLCIYTRGPQDDADLPLLENGLPDPVGFNKQVPHQYFDLLPGDMIIFASSRLYHTVERVEGSQARVTMGGFMGLSTPHKQCLYWS